MNPPVETIAYLNGDYLPLSEARISPLDRGFLFADGVYEVVPVYGGRPFRLAGHLRRLERSLAGIRIAPPHSPDEWRTIVESLVERNGGGDQAIYLQVTRGVAPREHAFPETARPTVFAMSQARTVPSEPDIEGVDAITVDDIRWARCDLKTIALLPNILLRQRAIEAGAYEAILVRDGHVTEGAASNVFIVEHGHLLTPPADHAVLPGITRDVVLELAAEAGLAHAEEAFDRGRLADADEIWLTSSTREIVPVRRLDGRIVGDGRPGPVCRRLCRLYREFTDRLRRDGGGA